MPNLIKVLRDRLATADLRLSVQLDTTESASGSEPWTTSPGRVVHDPQRAKLALVYAQQVIFTDAGDRGGIAFTACEAYAEEASMPEWKRATAVDSTTSSPPLLTELLGDPSEKIVDHQFT